MSGRPWDASYHDGPAPWDVDGPQPAMARLAVAGAFRGAVLDVGCGSGDNALLVASLGLPVLGVDVAATALARARAKAEERGLAAEFVLGDAFELDRLERTFDTVLDSGLFHTFDASERPRYVASLASVTRPGARLFVLCFRAGAPDSGPHPVTRDELTNAFHPATGWDIASVERDRVRTRFHDENGAAAWLATLARR
jgi:SAM-dependent methyltransferase